MTRYLTENGMPVIEKNVDAPSSLPLCLDGEVPNLGECHAPHRVTRTICLGSAPAAAAAHRGLEDRRVKLGCVVPGESPAVVGEALRRLAGAATTMSGTVPRLRDPSVLLAAVRDAVSLLTWERESFAFVDSFEEDAERERTIPQ